jgi:hypothetical protein
MSKLVESEWQKHSADMGIPLPRLTASKNRKLAITVHREGEPPGNSRWPWPEIKCKKL